MATKRIVIILALVVLVLLIGVIFLNQGEKMENGISLNEKELIEVWISENDLNQYGDPKDTVYIGGTPLFNETTGQSIDKYQYILEGNLDKPWMK